MPFGHFFRRHVPNGRLCVLTGCRVETVLNAAEGGVLSYLTWLDAAVILVALVTAVVGFWSGFVWQIIRIASVLAAFWIAAQFSAPLEARICNVLPAETCGIAAFAAILVGVLLAAYLLAHLLRGPIEAIRPEMMDHFLGFLFGLAKGLLLCGILALMIMRYTDPNSRAHEMVASAPLARGLAWCARALWALMVGA
jgi:membrane protein required for colicin V production